MFEGLFKLSGRAVAWLRDELPKYWKAAAAAAPAVIFVGTEVVQALQNGAEDGTLTSGDVYRIVLAGAAAYTVYKAKNKSSQG